MDSGTVQIVKDACLKQGAVIDDVQARKLADLFDAIGVELSSFQIVGFAKRAIVDDLLNHLV